VTNIVHTKLFNGIRQIVDFMEMNLMDNFYQILDLLYKFNKKMPEIPFGKLMHNLKTQEEKLWYLSDEEIVKRLEEFIKEDEE